MGGGGGGQRYWNNNGSSYVSKVLALRVNLYMGVEQKHKGKTTPVVRCEIVNRGFAESAIHSTFHM